MAKIARNAPCPCGSGKKYKRCCLPKDEAVREPAQQLPLRAGAPPPLSNFVDDDDNLDELSNRVVDLVNAGQLQEAETACEELKHAYPDVIDWIERTGMIHQARGENQKAIEYYERCLAYIDENPELFEEASRDWYRESINTLRQSLHTSQGKPPARA